MQVEGQREVSLLTLPATGARVSNAYPTCPRAGHSPAKVGLMPYAVRSGHLIRTKGFFRPGMGMRMISLPAG